MAVAAQDSENVAPRAEKAGGPLSRDIFPQVRHGADREAVVQKWENAHRKKANAVVCTWTES